MVLRYLVGLLGRNAHIIFNIVSQMGVPQRILFLLLKESGIYQMNVLEVGGERLAWMSWSFRSRSLFDLSYFCSCDVSRIFLTLTPFTLLGIYFLFFLDLLEVSSAPGCVPLLVARLRLHSLSLSLSGVCVSLPGVRDGDSGDV